MNFQQRQTRHRGLFASFYLTIIAWRYLLTPLGTLVWNYPQGDLGAYCQYMDVYVFGIRIMRFHKA